ncbi:glycoside hydrolase domain-containing protein [Streptomyces sp. GLT-R25]
MADELVLRAQRFVNQAYGDKIGMTVEENGRTGWSTMYALTRALQWELGISPVADSFGPTTLRVLTQKFPRLNSDTVPSANFCRIIQSAMYCKGYDGGDIDGVYNANVQAGITRLKQDMGVDGVYPGSDLTPKVFKGLLNMDPYVLVRYGDRPGDEDIRSIQRWLNGRYIHRQDFFVIPCDGHHSRDVAKSMLFAIQYELGMADGVANGSFGPATQAGLRQHTLRVGSTGVWVNLFTAAMILNQRPHIAFGGTFTSDLSSAVFEFQDFVRISPNGDGDYPTWASLLISYGDQSRSGAACDCITTITQARAQSLLSAGYVYVGRYLCNVPNGRDKMIKPGELQTIAANGLNCFPIYQTFSDGAAYFKYSQGTRDGLDAIDWAKYHGFKDGTRIYFAVDYDAFDHEVTSNILPHFRGIFRAVQENSRYRVGIYGPRNVCRRVREAGYTDASFVSDMSSGFSGNLGFPHAGGLGLRPDRHRHRGNRCRNHRDRQEHRLRTRRRAEQLRPRRGHRGTGRRLQRHVPRRHAPGGALVPGVHRRPRDGWRRLDRPGLGDPGRHLQHQGVRAGPLRGLAVHLARPAAQGPQGPDTGPGALGTAQVQPTGHRRRHGGQDRRGRRLQHRLGPDLRLGGHRRAEPLRRAGHHQRFDPGRPQGQAVGVDPAERGPDLQHQVGGLPDALQRPPDRPAEAGSEHE